MRFNPFVPHGPEPFTPTPKSGGPVLSTIEFFKKKIDELFRKDSTSVHYTREDKTNEEKTIARDNVGAQEKLVSGVNLKTVRGQSLLGSGDVPQVPAEWGGIMGNLGMQTDLAEALGGKADRSDVYTKSETDAKITANVENSVTSTSTTKALSANMGKELQDQIQNLKQRGRYLSIWNCAVGLAKIAPTVNPYEYKAGDYFIVGAVAEEGGTNYRPSGTSYDKDVPSTTVETGDPIVNDTYYYDGTNWTLLHTEQSKISWDSVVDKPTTFPPGPHTHTKSEITDFPVPVIPSTEAAEGVFASAKATAEFVNSSINNLAAYYLTYNAQGDAFPTKAALDAATTFYNGGVARSPTKNDYLIVLADEEHTTALGVNPTTRYVYDGAQWAFQYVVNNASLTQAQVDAINSGTTALLVNWLSAFKGSDTSTTLASVLWELSNKLSLTDGSLLIYGGHIEIAEAVYANGAIYKDGGRHLRFNFDSGRTGNIAVDADFSPTNPAPYVSELFNDTNTYLTGVIDAKITANVENSVTSTSTTKALSANMGKELQDQIQNLKQRGRYLSIWNCAVGLAKIAPTVNPYEYKAGDYFIVGAVAEEGGTNYRPSGTSYDKDVPSTTVETGDPIVNDTYYYDGTNWTLLHTEQSKISWDSVVDKPTTFPPGPHTHTKSEITDFPTEMPPTAHSHASDNWFTTAINSKADEAKPSFSTITINGVDYTEWTLGTRSGKIMLSVDMGGISTEIAAFNPVTGVFESAPSQYRDTLRFDGEAPIVGASPTLFDHVARESALSGKANISHTHTKSEITDFPTEMPPTAHSHASDNWFTEALSGKLDKTGAYDLRLNGGASIYFDGEEWLTRVDSMVSQYSWDWLSIYNTPTTLAGYGIEDASISGNTITLGSHSATIPTALKCPSALTIQLNGTTAATYDGSAARTVNITTGGAPGATVASAALEYHADGQAISVSVAAAGTLTAVVDNWTDGQSQMAFVTLAAGASIAPAIKLIGYSEWPVGKEFMAVCTKRGSKIYVNPVCSTEEL